MNKKILITIIIILLIGGGIFAWHQFIETVEKQVKPPVVELPAVISPVVTQPAIIPPEAQPSAVAYLRAQYLLNPHLIDKMIERGVNPQDLPPLSPPKDLELNNKIALSLLGIKECPTVILDSDETIGSCNLNISYVGARSGLDQDPQIRWTHFWNVTVTTDGLADDSVRAERIQATIAHHNGQWTKWGESYRTFQCQIGRGHLFFASGLRCF